MTVVLCMPCFLRWPCGVWRGWQRIYNGGKRIDLSAWSGLSPLDHRHSTSSRTPVHLDHYFSSLASALYALIMELDDTHPHLFFPRPLPLELLPRVASHLANTSQPISQSTLAYIARCSRHAYRIAQPLLYSTFYLDDDRTTYLFDNFIQLDEEYDGGETFPPYLFETFRDLHPVDMPSHLRILHNLWNVHTLVIKTMPYGQGVTLFEKFAQRLQDDGVLMLPKLKRVVIARSMLGRIARAEAIHKRIFSAILPGLQLASSPTHVCIDIPSDPPNEFQLDDEIGSPRQRVTMRRARSLFADRTVGEYFSTLDPEKTKEITTHLHGTDAKPISRKGMRHVLSFADDMPNPAEFMLGDEFEDMGDLLAQSAAGNIIDQIKHAIMYALNDRPSGTLGPGWVPTAPSTAPPEDSAPLSPAAQAAFWRRNPGGVDADPGAAGPSTAASVPGAVAGVSVLPYGTLIAPHTTPPDPPSTGSGTSFLIVLPGWMVLQPIEEAVRDWAVGQYAGTKEGDAVSEEALRFQSRGANDGVRYCEACGGDL